MNDQFEWKAEITFKGTADEFNEMTASLGGVLKTGRVKIAIPELMRLPPGHLCGMVACDLDVPSQSIKMSALAEGMPRVRLKPLPEIGGGIAGGIRIPLIAGGIRTPHLHLEEDVVLLDRDRFKTFVGEVARELASRHVDTTEDHVVVMNRINRLAE